MKSLPLTLTSRTLTPARLITITRMDGTIKRATEAQNSITIGGNTWTSVPGFVVSAIKHAIGGEPQQFDITASHSVGGFFSTADIYDRKYSGATVTVSICDRSNPTTAGTFFTGEITSIAFTTTGQVVFDVRGQSVKSASFVQTYAVMCRTDLFSSLCTLNNLDFDHTAEVAAIVDRHNFTINNLSATEVDGYFNDGVVRTETGFAFVVAKWIQSTLTITTHLPICQRMLTVGMDLTLWPGCDKRIATCFSKFNNTANFQGEPHFLGAAAVNG